MPELPEVEIAARNLRRWAVRRTIRAVRADPRARRIFRPAKSGQAVARTLNGARFRDVRRNGKNLLVTLDDASGSPVGIWSHLGMTGKWLRRRAGDPASRFSRLELDLDDGTRLHYDDLRLFGRFRLVPGARFDDVPELRALGPDPLEDGIDEAALHARLAKLRLPIKVAMLDQRLLPGVGNIQASEALNRAGIDPRRPARTLTPREVGALARGVRASIAYTLRDFAKHGADGGDADVGYVEEGAPNPFRVYARAGARCPRCRKGVVSRVVQAGRATFYCPACQR